jgi:hypothetical protein
MRITYSLLVSAVLLLVSVPAIHAQGTNLGTIRGTVTDPSGAVIPGVKVEIVDLDTNLSHQYTTNTEGNYEAPALRSGRYKVLINAPGFSRAEINGVTVAGSDAVRADAHLQPASTTETVVITSEAPLIQTESQTISSTLDNRTILSIPRDNRDIYSYLYLNPNITQSAADGAFKFIGAQSYGASFSLDGQRSNGGVFGEPTSSQPSLEAIGELTVLSNDFTAEYAGIANVRVETKRGEINYHGSGFYNNKNSALAAWNLRDKIAQTAFVPTPEVSRYPTPYFNLNELGGSLGGPVPLAKKTFFLFAYERRWSGQQVALSSIRLPHPSLWNGDFSLLRDANKPAVPPGVNLTASEIANNTVGGAGKQFIQIPQRLLNPITAALIKNYFPKLSVGNPINTTNGRVPRFYQNLPALVTRDLGTMRIDHDFNERNRVYAVYNISSQNGGSSAVVNPFPGLGISQTERMNHTVSLSYTHLFAGNLINEARGGFNKQALFRRSNTTLRGFLSSIGFDGSDITAYGNVIGPQLLDTYGHLAIAFQGNSFQAFSNGGRNTDRPLDQNLMTYGDTLSWIKGRHTFKFGADIVRNAALDGFVANRGNPRGLLTYNGNGPDTFARFLLGLPATTVSYIDKSRPPLDVYNWETGFFAQDDFKIGSRITLNYGLRYELITPFIDNNDLLVNFDPTYVKNGIRTGRFIIPSQKALPLVDPRMVAFGLVTADQIGIGRGLVHTDKNNLAPRLGAAWRITQHSVLRGGFGVYYPTSAAQGMRDAMESAPFNQGRTKRGATLSPWPGAAHGFSPLDGGTLNTAGSQPSVNNIPFDLQQPRILQYNATFEQELGWKSSVRISYLGTRMNGLITGADLNMIAPSDTPFGTTTGDGVTACSPDEGDCDLSPADLARRPYPALGDYMSSYGNFGHARSHALQIEGRRRYANGFMFNLAYTLLDQQSNAVDSANSSLGGTAYNQFRPDNDFARDSFVSRHRFVAFGVVESPVGRGRKYGSQMSNWVDAFAGGWQTSWNMFAKSGTGFTPFWTCDNCGPAYPGNGGSSFIDAVGDFNYGTSFRPLVVGQAQRRSGDQIFDPAAFTVPTVGADAIDNPKAARRNFLTGPGTWGVNLGIQKAFHLGERVQMNFGAEFNNIFNHPLFAPDNSDFANLGSFAIGIDPKTNRILPITNITPNPDFGRLLTSYTQEGIDSRRTTRLKLRFTF